MTPSAEPAARGDRRRVGESWRKAANILRRDGLAHEADAIDALVLLMLREGERGRDPIRQI